MFKVSSYGDIGARQDRKIGVYQMTTMALKTSSPLIPVIPAASAVNSITATDLLTEFLAGRSERTVRAYRTDLADFATWLGMAVEEGARVLLAHGPGSANRLVLAYKAHLRHQLAPATVNRRLAALRSLVKMARTVGLVAWQLEVRSERTEAYRDTQGPSDSGYQRLLGEAERRTDAKGRRDLAMVRLLHDVALRCAEVARLDLADLDLPGRHLQVIGKGRREPIQMTLPESTCAMLGRWVEIRGPDPGPLFTSCDRAAKGDGRLTSRGIHGVIKNLGSRVGLKIGPHALRHRAVTKACERAAQVGIGLEEVRQFSRHRDVRTLLVYRDHTRDVQGRLADLVASDLADVSVNAHYRKHE
jgi:integrase/recombinase XerC